MTAAERAERIQEVELLVDTLLEWGWRLEEATYTRDDGPDLTAAIKVSISGDRAFEVV